MHYYKRFQPKVTYLPSYLDRKWKNSYAQYFSLIYSFSLLMMSVEDTKSAKNSPHRARVQLSFLDVIKYSRFFRPEYTIVGLTSV